MVKTLKVFTIDISAKAISAQDFFAEMSVFFCQNANRRSTLVMHHSRMPFGNPPRSPDQFIELAVCLSVLRFSSRLCCLVRGTCHPRISRGAGYSENSLEWTPLEWTFSQKTLTLLRVDTLNFEKMLGQIFAITRLFVIGPNNIKLALAGVTHSCP